MKKTVIERFLEKVEKTGTCWLWTGSISQRGYGFFQDGKLGLAHRWSMENLNMKKIPKGLCVDHLCRVRHCVNPEHLEIVTYKENVRRGKTPGKHPERAKKVCNYGHKIEGDNEYWQGVVRRTRHCHTCIKDYGRERRRIIKGYYLRHPEETKGHFHDQIVALKIV